MPIVTIVTGIQSLTHAAVQSSTSCHVMEFTFDVRGVLPNEITRNPRGRLQSGPGPGRDR